MRPHNDLTPYQALFEHSSLGIIISNAQGIIEQVNPFAGQLFGYEKEELISKPIEVLIPSRFKGSHVGHRTGYQDKPKPRSMGAGMDLLAMRKDGTEFPVEISLASFETNGAKQIVSFINDISQRKKAEEAIKKLNSELEDKVKERTNELSQAIMELQHINESVEQEMDQRKKAEDEVRLAFEQEKELSELKSRFVSMASHEFRTPLSGILTSVSLIERYGKEADHEKRDRHVQTIKSLVHNLTNILNDFLSLDKLEQGKIECNPGSFVLQDFLDSLVEDMQSHAGQEQRLVLTYRGDDGTIYSDKDMLRNVLINLLSNAMKYSEPDKIVRLTSDLSSSQVVLMVQDEGIGIPKADQKHMFESFFRAQNASAIQGTGLGLHIVKRYLDIIGGTIRFASQENVGSTFVVTLPRTLKT